MARYGAEFKEQGVRKQMAPDAKSVAGVCRETGGPGPSLVAWRNQAGKGGWAVVADPSNPEQWSLRTKLAAVIETAGPNVQEVSEYCGRNGLFSPQIERRRQVAARPDLEDLFVHRVLGQEGR